MKVLTTPTGQVLALGFGAFRTFDGEVTTLDGVVAERSEGEIRAEAMKAGVDNEFGQREEEIKMLKSVAKSLAAWEVGDTVACKTSGKQGAIAIPKPERAPVRFAVGDVCAFNDSCSPKYLMNTRVTITEVNGSCHSDATTASQQTVRYTLDAGDLDRLKRSGKSRAAKGRGPTVILDKVS
jgi:hypothetical protein